MPTYKHPCPHCGVFIERDVAACPACGRPDPFAPGRCPKCQATIVDLSWIACPKCGQALSPTTGAGTARAAAPSVPPAATPPATAQAAAEGSGAGRCTGCNSPLPAGARFCRECGTLVG